MAGLTQTKMAESIGVHKSTVSRELSDNVATRGRYVNEYRPQLAQRKTNQRYHNKPKQGRFTHRKATNRAMAQGRKALARIDHRTLEGRDRWCQPRDALPVDLDRQSSKRPG